MNAVYLIMIGILTVWTVVYTAGYAIWCARERKNFLGSVGVTVLCAAAAVLFVVNLIYSRLT